MAGKAYIGTSGWHYKHWSGTFYPEKFSLKAMFAFYAKHFQTVEINNSFYHLPEVSTFISWRENSPEDFIFAVKASRFITHMKKLKAPKTSTEKLFVRVEKLENKLGPILFQLPPSWNLNLERLSMFLEALPMEHRYTFEFRNQSWLVKEVLDLLSKHNAAFCIYDLAGFETPAHVTANFAYIRLHGPGGKYQGDYPKSKLTQWATYARNWIGEGRDTFIYFDNDQQAFAVKNAQELMKMI